MSHCYNNCHDAWHRPSVDVIKSVPMALLDFPSTQSVNMFIENAESFKRGVLILHNSFPDIGDDTVEPGKVSHCEEIYNERQC